MICRTSLPVDIDESAEFLQELRGEVATTVGDYAFRGPKILEDSRSEQACQLLGIGYPSTGNEFPHFGEFVHYNQYGVVSFVADR